MQNFREVPPPLPRRVHLARIESARRCWLHVHRDADHAKTFNEALRRKFTCVAAHPFVGQDSRTSVALCTACSALRAIPSLRSALTAFGGYVLIVCRFLYDIAPSAISSAELCLAYLWQSCLTLFPPRIVQVGKTSPPPFGSRSAETATTSATSSSLRRLDLSPAVIHVPTTGTTYPPAEGCPQSGCPSGGGVPPVAGTRAPPCATRRNLVQYAPSNPRIASANGCRAVPKGAALAF